MARVSCRHGPPLRPTRPLTVEEYLALEHHSEQRHEFVAGEMFAMDGASLRHNRICSNILIRLDAAAGNGPCQLFINDVKVRAASDRIYYPDLVVVVISPSTRRVDRGETLDAYRRLPPLQAYLVIEQGVRWVERHWREAGGEWQTVTVTDPGDGGIPVPCPSTVLTLDEIYRGIALDLPAEAPAERPRRVREEVAG